MHGEDGTQGPPDRIQQFVKLLQISNILGLPMHGIDGTQEPPIVYVLRFSKNTVTLFVFPTQINARLCRFGFGNELTVGSSEHVSTEPIREGGRWRHTG